MKPDIIERQKDLVRSFWDAHERYSSEVKEAQAEYNSESQDADQIKQNALNRIESVYHEKIEGIKNAYSERKSQCAALSETIKELLSSAKQELKDVGLNPSWASLTTMKLHGDDVDHVFSNKLPSAVNLAQNYARELSVEIVQYNAYKDSKKTVLTVLSVVAVAIVGLLLYKTSEISIFTPHDQSINHSNHNKAPVRESISDSKDSGSQKDLKKGINELKEAIKTLNGQVATTEEEEDDSGSGSTEDGLSYVNQMLQSAMDNGGISNNDAIINTAYALNSKYPCPKQKHKKNARDANERGIALNNDKMKDKALEEFQAAYNLDPTDIEITSNLGNAYLKVGDLANAKRLLLQTLVHDPGRATAWGNLGEAYAQQGDIRSAVAAFANTLRFTRNTENTRKYFNILIELANDSNVKQAAEQALQLPYIEPRQPKFCSKEK